MTEDDLKEEKLLRSVALQNASSIFAARQRAEDALVRAKEALEIKSVELAHSLAMMHATLESTTDGILVTDEEHRVWGLNEKFAQMWGIPPTNLSSKENQNILDAVSRQLKEPRQFLTRIQEINALSPRETFDLLELADGRVFERFSKVQFVDKRDAGRVWSFRDITERKRADEALRTSQAQFSATINQSPVGIFMVDAQLRLQHVNPKARPVFGEAEKLIGRNLEDVMHILWTPAVAQRILERFRHTLATGLPFYAPNFSEYRVDRRAQEYFDWQLHRITLPNGAHAAVCYFIDISAHVLAQQKAQESAERLNFSMSSMNLGWWNWDVATDAISFSERTADIFGLPVDSKMTRTQMREAIHPEDRERARIAAENSVGTRTDYDIEYRLIHPARGVRWVAAKGRGVFGEDGRMNGMMGVAQDVTERKHAEIQLCNQRDVLEQIVQGKSLPEILESLTSGVEQFVERRIIATVLLMEPDGRHLRPVAGKNAPEAWSRYIDGVAIGPTAGSCGTAAYRKQRVISADIAADPLWSAFKAEALKNNLRACWSTPIVSSNGKVLGTFAIYYSEPSAPTVQELEIVDVITRTAAIAIERKQSEQALRESQAKLAEHARELELRVAERTAKLRETIGELEAFSYSVSHDLRAPLRAIQGYADALLTDYASKLDEEGIHYLKRMGRNAERLELLVRDILTYSKVTKEEIELSPVDLDSLLTSLLSEMPQLQPLAAKVALQKPLPTVFAHEAYLSQIFSNLLANAVKFVAPGVVPEIQIWAEDQGGMVRISVRDNGIGIDPGHFDRIFQIFGRVYADSKFEGTGIGLSIVKKAVQRLGGVIGVDSAIGTGSCFWFTVRKT